MKKTVIVLLAMLAILPTAGAQNVRFGRYFTGGTLRLDCVRQGAAEWDTVWVEHWIDRMSEWHGSRKQLLDPFDNGDYRVEMRDAKTLKPIYSRCYSNLFREYKDTPEGRTTMATFEEVLLLPMPSRKVQIALQKRDEELRFADATVVEFDPSVKGQLEYRFRMAPRVDLEVHGSPANKVDVVIVAQGYGDSNAAQLSVDYYRMKEILFGKQPFSSHRNDFNVYGVRADVGAEYGVFGADRYLMTFDLFRLHDAIGLVPCDYIIIMVNNETYGGGAIYNFYAVSSLHRMAEYVLPHELGHAFGGLADEYVDEDLSYGALHRKPTEPTEPNITNLVDFGSKWQDMLPDATPIPTPDNNAVPASENGPLGVYEGAGYSATGVYRPAMHCMMRDYAPFCPVCMKRLEAIFNLYTR